MLDVLKPGSPPPTPPNKARREGDYVIKFVKLVAYNGAAYDVSAIHLGINIYEDIWNNVATGDITFQDANDLAQLYPLIGEERIKIRFTRPDNSGDGLLDENVDIDFRIYKMSNRQLEKDKFQVYTLHFVADEFITSLKTKLSMGFDDMLYSEMVDIAFKKLGSSKPIEIEETMFEHKYTVPYIHPIEFINTLAAKSISAAGNGACYVFFCDRDKFHFKSMGLLLDQPPVETYTYQWSNVLENENNEGYRSRTIDQDFRAFERYGFEGSFDVLNNLISGMYASKLLTYDLTRQIFEVKEFDYIKEFDTFKHLDKNPPLTPALDALGSPAAVSKFMHTNLDHDKVPWIVAHEPGIKPWHIEEYVLYRYSQMQQVLGTHRVMVSVTGDPRRKVGQTIEFLLPQAVSKVDKENPEELDKYLQGKYLITSLVHRITGLTYAMEAEIVKDTYKSEIEHIDPNKHYDGVW